eukprot:4662496-Prorocentrum_lima.AAC.1
MHSYIKNHHMDKKGFPMGSRVYRQVQFPVGSNSMMKLEVKSQDEKINEGLFTAMVKYRQKQCNRAS